jgi:hypothetical protein
MGTSGGNHANHEGPSQRDRYKRKEHRPAENDKTKTAATNKLNATIFMKSRSFAE